MFAAAITVNQHAKILYIKPSENLGEFQKHVQGTIGVDKTTLVFAFINPRTTIDFELLLSDYEEGSLTLDSTGPGMELRRREANKWDISTSVVKNLKLSMAGIHYDPSASSMSEIAAELKALRRYLQQK